jgi:arabinose-5-phosphate isomerase
MRPDPLTIHGEELAPAALNLMEQRRITSLFVCGEERQLEGIVHLHDLWGLELF